MNEAQIKTKRLEILEDTIKYYSEDITRRAVINDNCQYITKDGKKCAIGRLIPNDKIELVRDETGTVYSLIGKLKYKGVLPEDILYLGMEFLRDLQSLHDGNGYWDKNGLNEVGKNSVEIIKAKYIN